MRVQEIMTPNPACVPADATLRDAADMMRRRDCGAVPVVEEEGRRLVGIITDRDIACRAVAEGRDPEQTLVREIMSPQVLSVPPEASLEAALEKMESAQIRRLPIVDGRGTCLGILSQADIARQMSAQETAELVACISEPSIGPSNVAAHG